MAQERKEIWGLKFIFSDMWPCDKGLGNSEIAYMGEDLVIYTWGGLRIYSHSLEQ